MSLFVVSPCKLSSETDNYVNICAWSQIDQIVAVACTSVDDKNTEIHQGEVVSKSLITHEAEATVFDWHPSERTVAIGWGDGMVSCWNVDGKIRPTSTFSNTNQHTSSITVVKWNPMGKRLVTADSKGSVRVWAVDSRGNLAIKCKYNSKKSPITCMVYCLMTLRVPELSNNNSVQRTNGKGEISIKQSYSPSFFFGTNDGALVYADDLDHCTDVQKLNSSIDVMMFLEEKSRLIIITRSFLLSQYHVAEDGKVSRLSQFKLSVPNDISDRGIKSTVWAGPGLIATATEEKIIRCFDLAADESYNLSLAAALGDSLEKNDKVVCVAFSPIDRYLAVGTALGVVAVWKFVGSPRDISGNKSPVTPTSVNDWEAIFKTNLKSLIVQLVWHAGRGTLAAITQEEGVFILNESILYSGMSGDVTVVQVSSEEVALFIGLSPEPIVINTKMQIKSLAVGRSCFAISSGKTARVYRVDNQLQKFEQLEPFKTSTMAMAIADSTHLADEAWFVAEANIVKINNFTGTMKGSVTFSEAEGVPEHLDINGKFLAIVTNKGFIKVIDVHTPSKTKPLGTAGQFFNPKSSINADTIKIRNIRVNSSGTRVAIITDYIEGSLQICHPDSRLHIYDRNKGAVSVFDFKSLKRCPISIFWDDTDDRLISCEAVRTRVSPDSKKNNPLSGQQDEKIDNQSSEMDQKNNNNNDNELDSEIEVYLFFATSENGILMQDSFSRKYPNGSMLALSVPRLYFRNSLSGRKDEEDGEKSQASNSVKIYSRVMRDFVGMEDINEMTKVALLDFSYNLTLGKLDEAYRAVKAIDSPAVWENMAQMCVKTRRIDVAEVCLGNMGHVRGAAAVREAKESGNGDTTVGVLAIQLGLLDDAARIFREVGRYDMLNKLFQAAGLWDKAIDTANKFDRIHIKTTHYQYAKHLESIGRIDEAIEHFQMSENSRTEVPRMLFHLGRVDELGEYVMKSDDPSLLKWWASYLESIERFDKAKKFYSKAEDYLSLVRICCFKNDFHKAAEIVQESGDRASAYHFARQLENQGEYQEAINFYAVSGCYNHSIRLAKAYGLDTELMRFAVKSTLSLMIECAVYFEEKQEFDKAVQLYHKGGDIPRALDLCFRVGEQDKKSPQANLIFDMLNTIAQDLGSESSPQTLARCAEFLVQHKQFEKAVELLVMAKRYHSAIEMCLQHKVNINDDMVEKLTPPETMEAAERKEMLLDLAKALKKQGSFTLASKKYTQAGDRVHAIKCLVRSGDTKSVIQFASISRNIEIYKLAANYLQQMNWRESVDIMKAIITFYTKAKSFIQLAGFYDSCAQVEIDEYRDYEKAIGALKEALKYLAKESSHQSEEMTSVIEKRIIMIEKFVLARKAAKKDPNTMVNICEDLLREPMLEEAIRSGDCLAMLVEYYHGNKQMREAYKYLQEMENRRIQLHPYVDTEIIEDIYKSVGVSSSSNNNKSKAKINESKSVDDDEEIYQNQNSGPKKSSVDSMTINHDDEDNIDEDIDEELDADSPVNKKQQRPSLNPTNKYFNSGNARK